MDVEELWKKAAARVISRRSTYLGSIKSYIEPLIIMITSEAQRKIKIRLKA